MHHHTYDVLIIGAGAAGMSVALNFPSSISIAIINKGEINSGSTYWAQGGIAAAIDSMDTRENHLIDTLKAGVGLCDKKTAANIINRGPEIIQWLLGKGINFTRNYQSLHLALEGGHSHPRIIHSTDSTGRAISNTLLENIKQRHNIDLFENLTAIDLITNNKRDTEQCCIGAYTIDSKSADTSIFEANHTVLATGGASRAYIHTTNKAGSTGDGIAIAWRAGCRICNMEFNQFHPTSLYHKLAKSVLISETIRGEGGLLVMANGQRFMDKFDERAELAPRDIVARAIDYEIKRTGSNCAFLDISHRSEHFIKKTFPNIYETCLLFNIDITKEPIPIIPAAHYTCGGIMVNQKGQTDINNLYAVGECSYTGLHGANRLASNSLLECIVMAQETVKAITANLTCYSKHNSNYLPSCDKHKTPNSHKNASFENTQNEIRKFMWKYVGIVRTKQHMLHAQNHIKKLKSKIHTEYNNSQTSCKLIELRNLVTVSELIIRSSLNRKESRGLHFRLDYPQTNKKALLTTLTPDDIN